MKKKSKKKLAVGSGYLLLLGLRLTDSNQVFFTALRDEFATNWLSQNCELWPPVLAIHGKKRQSRLVPFFLHFCAPTRLGRSQISWPMGKLEMQGLFYFVKG